MRSPWLKRLVVLLAVAGCGTPVNPGMDVQAPDAPTRQTATTGPGRATLKWRNTAEADFSLTAVVRYAGGDMPVKPTGTPVKGDSLGSGIVVYVGADEFFVDDQVPSGCGPYFWALWSRDTSGNWSGGAATIEPGRGATSTPPSAPVTQLQAQVLGTTVALSWTNPAAATGFYQSVVVRRSGTTAPAKITDGTSVYVGSSQAANDAFVGTQSYGVFACNACGLCMATPATVTATSATIDAGITDSGIVDAGVVDAGSSSLDPSGFSASLSVDGQHVNLAWTNSTSTELTGVKIVRVLNAHAVGPMDTAAATVFTGTGSVATDAVDQLLPDVSSQPRTYFYTVYGCAGATCETPGATASLAVTLKQALRGGGYTLFWRHCSASTCGDSTNLGTATSTTSPNWWKTCSTDCSVSTARQLTDPAAANEIAAIGGYFRNNGISMSRVLSSEYCRAKSSATGFAFGPAVEERPELTYFVHDETNRCFLSNALMNLTPAPGANIGMVSHAGFVCPTLDSLAWGEAAIYKPQPPSTRTCAQPGNTCMANEGCQNGFCVKPLFIGRVAAFDWTALP